MKVRILITIGILFCLACQAQVVDCCELEQEDVIEYVDVNIFSGQSNMGRSVTGEMTAEEQTAYAGTHDSVMIHNGRYAATFQTMVIGTNTILDGVGEFGAEASLYKSLNQFRNKKRYLIKYGVGNTSMYLYWKPGGIGYTALIDNVADAIAEIAAAGKYPRLSAFYWMQGENDATSPTWAAAYEDNLELFFDTFKNDYDSILALHGFVQRWPWVKVLGKINGIDNPTMTERETVRAAQVAYCAVASNNAILIDTDDLPLKDNVHYSARGQILLGQRIYEIIKDR